MLLSVGWETGALLCLSAAPFGATVTHMLCLPDLYKAEAPGCARKREDVAVRFDDASVIITGHPVSRSRDMNVHAPPTNLWPCETRASASESDK
jgi:hypothetical protein